MSRSARSVSAAFYVNNIKNDILFTRTERPLHARESAARLAAAAGRDRVASLGDSFPARFTYLNFGKSTQRGLELGVNGPVTADIGAFVNYS